ncbi:MAG TPA: hypothetical protein VK110_05405, partial [Salinisphaeraceae bacterium]|nr:hypothetical protein [Salinisphaeraceae bacterium]
YTREDFLNDLPADAMIIASLNAQGALLFRSVKKATRLAAGDTVIYYAPRKNGKSGGRQPSEPVAAAGEKTGFARIEEEAKRA